MKISEIVWDPAIYPRAKWNTNTIKSYADAMLAGANFPPIIVEQDTMRLLDGKHRLEARKLIVEQAELAVRMHEHTNEKEGIDDEQIDAEIFEDIDVEIRDVPDGMTPKYFAMLLSADNGLRPSNADLKALGREECEAVEDFDPQTWGLPLGLTKSTVYRWVSDILNKRKAGRAAKAWRLSQLGWTQTEIGERLGVSRNRISEIVENSQLGKIDTDLGMGWNRKGVADWAEKNGVDETTAMAAVMGEMNDAERFAEIDINTQPYDVWHFPKCHDLMGDKHPGRIPGELICHALYFFTQPGDLVLDPMAGSGTTLDACLLMGRKTRGYDIDERHERVDIENHDLSNGWPEKTGKADLIFWDPPYFSKKDDEYIEGSISGMDRWEYFSWLDMRLHELFDVTHSHAKLLFLMSDWDDPQKGSNGIFLWDYVRLLQDAGWKITRQIQTPLSTQQIHPDIVNKFRSSRRLARLGRYLLVCEK